MEEGKAMMKCKSFYNDKILNGFFAVLTAVFMLATLAGCVGGNSGTLKWDRELDNKFVSYQVLPDHRYYITGGYSAPAVILAIHNDYQLENGADLWVEVPDVSSTHMQKWIDNLSSDISFWEENQFLASYVLDPNGKRVGAWYSGRRNTAVMFLEDNRIKVYPPDMKPNFGGDEREKGIKKP
jgi:hypothetical protein